MPRTSDDLIDAVLRSPRRNDIFERVIRAVCEASLAAGDLAVDGGAALGEHTFPMAAAVGRDGHVLAYEPFRPAAAFLRHNLRERGLRQVAVVNAALSDHAGTADFHHVRNSFYFSGLRRRVRYPFEPEIDITRVKAVTLDAELAVVDRWRLAKLDLEGGEFRALQGGAAAIARHHPLLIVQSGRVAAAEAYGYDADVWFGFFDDLGYRLFTAFGDEIVPARWYDARTGNTCLAAPCGSADEAYLGDALPGLLRLAATEIGADALGAG